MFMELAHLQLRNKREREYSETSRFIQCCGPIHLETELPFLVGFLKIFQHL